MKCPEFPFSKCLTPPFSVSCINGHFAGDELTQPDGLVWIPTASNNSAQALTESEQKELPPEGREARDGHRPAAMEREGRPAYAARSLPHLPSLSPNYNLVGVHIH